MHVYAIEQRDGMVKIGRSRKPTLRINNISREIGGGIIRAWVSMPTSASIAAEISAHDILDSSRVYGEWFNVDFDEAVSAIVKAIDTSIAKPEKAKKEWSIRFKAARTARKLTQDSVAKVAGVSRAAIAQWELGFSDKCDAEALLLASKAMGVSPYFIMFGECATAQQTPADAILATLTEPQRAQALRMLAAFAELCRAAH
ncbi:MAG: helix-turn-helix domain-containing protein [Alphaproteobacteria bacterium]|nr:helix-turn-helix domain-containing protein [Alphaproteobacteria bacterium]